MLVGVQMQFAKFRAWVSLNQSLKTIGDLDFREAVVLLLEFIRYFAKIRLSNSSHMIRQIAKMDWPANSLYILR